MVAHFRVPHHCNSFVLLREILIDWLIEVHLNFQLQEETLFLVVNLLDRFLERRSVEKTKLQLVGCVAMLLACKVLLCSAPFGFSCTCFYIYSTRKCEFLRFAISHS